jgi:hypothetical protein
LRQPDPRIPRHKELTVLKNGGHHMNGIGQEVAPIFLGSRLGRVSYGTISRAFQQYLSTHRFEIYRFAPDQQIQIDALQVRMMLPFRSNQNFGERQLTRDGHTGAIA